MRLQILGVSPRPSSCIVSLVLLFAAVTPARAAAQVRPSSPDTLLAWLASSEVKWRNGAASGIHAAFAQNYAHYTDAQRRELLDGVEEIARGEVSGDELRAIRSLTTAFSILNSIALDTVLVPTDREIPGRLLRIYRESRRREARSLAVASVGDLLPRYANQSPMNEMLELLESVATAPFSPDSVHPNTAVSALLEAGELGRNVLRRLHERGAIRNPETAVFVREIAKRGYRSNELDG